MITAYDGDPKLILTENGSTLKFTNGQPLMDPGLENLVLISLFTKKGWVGNSLYQDDHYKIGSDFLKVLSLPITINSLNQISNIVKNTLKNDIFGDVTVVVTNPSGHKIDIQITIEPPGKELNKILLSKNGLNWQFQILEPANRRL